MPDAFIENLEDFLAVAQILHGAREDLPWEWGRFLHSLSRPQMDTVVKGSVHPGADPPNMGLYYTYAEVYPWFPHEEDRELFPDCLVRSQTLTWSHHLLLYVMFLTRKPPDRAAAEEWLQKADEESWKLWQLRKALGGGDPTPIPHFTVKVKGKPLRLSVAESIIRQAVLDEFDPDAYEAAYWAIEVFQRLILDERLAVASLLKEEATT